jgi:hypothetical protein
MQFAFGFLGVATIKRITVAVAAGEEAQVRHAVSTAGHDAGYHVSLQFTGVVRIQVGNLMQPALLLAAIVGLALVTTTYAIADQLLMLVATPQGIHGAAKTYLSIRILSQPAVIRPFMLPHSLFFVSPGGGGGPLSAFFIIITRAMSLAGDFVCGGAKRPVGYEGSRESALGCCGHVRSELRWGCTDGGPSSLGSGWGGMGYRGGAI